MGMYLEKWKREYDDFCAEEKKHQAERQFGWSGTEHLAPGGPLSHCLLAQRVYEGPFTPGNDSDSDYADLDWTRTLSDSDNPGIDQY
jgi:hypothetical protein